MRAHMKQATMLFPTHFSSRFQPALDEEIASPALIASLLSSAGRGYRCCCPRTPCSALSDDHGRRFFAPQFLPAWIQTLEWSSEEQKSDTIHAINSNHASRNSFDLRAQKKTCRIIQQRVPVCSNSMRSFPLEPRENAHN